MAQAASVARYAGHRSLVAVFLLGGNDGNQLVVPRDALDAFWLRSCSASEVLAALAFARDGSRWAPWIEAVEGTVKVC